MLLMMMETMMINGNVDNDENENYGCDMIIIVLSLADITCNTTYTYRHA
jgi:hypothetical protein